MNLPKTDILPYEHPSDDFYTNRRFQFCGRHANYWIECRESFAAEFSKEFYFHSRNYKDCIKRIHKLESRMGFKNKTKFYKTKYGNVILVRVPLFWTKNDLRKSVFTAVLKSQKRYLSSKNAKEFLKLFTKGYTKEGSDYDKWHGVADNIRYCYKKDIRSLIRK